MDTEQLIFAGAALVAILGAVGAWWARSGRPRWRAVIRFFDRLDLTINGRPAQYDAYGRVESAAVPALAEQMSGVQAKLDALARNDERLTAVEKTVAALGQTVATHGQRITDVEHLHQVERIAGQVTQGKVIDAIAEANRHRDADYTVDDDG